MPLRCAALGPLGDPPPRSLPSGLPCLRLLITPLTLALTQLAPDSGYKRRVVDAEGLTLALPFAP